MIGDKPCLLNLAVELEEEVAPISLECEESLSPDTEGEEEELENYNIFTECPCGASVCIVVEATPGAARTLHLLLHQELKVVCISCAEGLLRHGRQ